MNVASAIIEAADLRLRAPMPTLGTLPWALLVHCDYAWNTFA